LSKEANNSSNKKQDASATPHADNANAQIRETTIEKVVSAGARGEHVDLDQIKLKVLILCKTRNALESSAQFLDRRGWKTVITTDIKEIFKIITAFSPDIFLLSVNYPNEKIAKLPAIIFTSFKTHVVTFGELGDTKTLKLMQTLPANYKMPGSISGPNIQRRLKQILQELYSPTSINAVDSNVDNKQKDDQVKVSGADNAKTKDGIKIFANDKSLQSKNGYFPQNNTDDGKEKQQSNRNPWANKGGITAGELSLTEEDEKLTSKYKDKNEDELINDLMNEFSDDGSAFANKDKNQNNTSSRANTNSSGINTDEILEAVAEVSEKSSFNELTSSANKTKERLIAENEYSVTKENDEKYKDNHGAAEKNDGSNNIWDQKDEKEKNNTNYEAGHETDKTKFNNLTQETKERGGDSFSQSGADGNINNENEHNFDIDKHTSHLSVVEQASKLNKKVDITVDADGSVQYDGKITIERILREAANAATEKKSDETIKLLYASESLIIPIKFEGKSGIIIVVQEGLPYDKITFENKFMHFLMRMNGKMGLEIGNTQRVTFEKAEVKELTDPTIINFKTRNQSGEAFITHSPLGEFKAQVKPANYGKAEIAIIDVVEEIKIGADLYLHLPQNEKFYKVANRNGWISPTQKNRLVKSNVAVFINADDLDSYKESQKTARAIDKVKSRWPKAKKTG
jgi:hypothetical protein